MVYNRAIEVIKNAQNYSMIEIREAEKAIDEMVDKAEAFDELAAIPDWLDNEMFREEVKSILRNESEGSE